MKCCPKCGNDKLIKGIRYCLNCGTEVEVKSKTKAKEKFCPDCDNKLIEGIGYCLECGKKVGEKEEKRRVTKSRLSVELFEILS